MNPLDGYINRPAHTQKEVLHPLGSKYLTTIALSATQMAPKILFVFTSCDKTLTGHQTVSC